MVVMLLVVTVFSFRPRPPVRSLRISWSRGDIGEGVFPIDLVRRRIRLTASETMPPSEFWSAYNSFKFARARGALVVGPNILGESAALRVGGEPRRSRQRRISVAQQSLRTSSPRLR